MILNQKAIESISEKLTLPYTGIEQDWDVEMANPLRIKEFLCYYKNSNLLHHEKVALMSLIIASYEDSLYNKENKIDNSKFWDDIKIILKSNLVLFTNLITYWSLPNEKMSDDLFKVTPLIRTLVVIDDNK